MAVRVLLDHSEFDSLTISEMKFQQAKLTLDAERLRAVWRGSSFTSSRSAAMARQVKILETRARDYARILALMGGAV